MFIMVAKSPRDVEAGVGPVILDALADPVGPLLRGTLILGHPEPNVVELYMLVQVDDRVNLRGGPLSSAPTERCWLDYLASRPATRATGPRTRLR